MDATRAVGLALAAALTVLAEALEVQAAIIATNKAAQAKPRRRKAGSKAGSKANNAKLG
ncbi:MAG: hypothetical protein Q7J52_24080 [Falsiroseomonas sp.]|nr:hypothetical protein [Falsiroseomonas sp.]